MIYRVITIDLTNAQLTPQILNLDGATQICFVRFLPTVQGSSCQKLTEDVLQISIDNSPYIPFRPFDKIGRSDGCTVFSELRYRILFGIPYIAEILVSDKLCMMGIGPREEVAITYRNGNIGASLLRREYVDRLNIAFGANDTVLLLAVPSARKIRIYRINIMMDPALPIVAAYYDLLYGVLNKGSWSWHKSTTDVNSIQVFPIPLEIYNTGILPVNLTVQAYNLDGAAAQKFWGYIEYDFIPINANWDALRELEGH